MALLLVILLSYETDIPQIHFIPARDGSIYTPVVSAGMQPAYLPC
jgi:hypothetical protein